ncbi:MAG TPA: hypothetical protein VFU23_03115, partial [Gemmatimonadales bacterium]|nr:hypothetical protein [Gemmatimonadales bacterium]
MKLARILLAAVAVGAVTQSASAQFNPGATTSQDILKVTSFGPFNPYGIYTGQLMASPGQPTVDLLCDDFLHHISFNTPYAVNITRYDAGAAALDARTLYGSTKLNQYMQAAYLSNYFAGLSNASVVQDLNFAIGHLFTPAAPNTTRAGEAVWVALLG